MIRGAIKGKENVCESLSGRVIVPSLRGPRPRAARCAVAALARCERESIEGMPFPAMLPCLAQPRDDDCLMKEGIRPGRENMPTDEKVEPLSRLILAMSSQAI